MVDKHATETKLAAARTRLILDKPFLGTLVLRLPLKATRGDWCPTTATDARHVYYNPEYIEKLSLEEVEFTLAHEALHCALRHFARRGHRLKHRWDIACDLAINPLLIGEGLPPPEDSLCLPQFENMTAEEIYPLLDDNAQMNTLDRHLYDTEQGTSLQRTSVTLEQRSNQHRKQNQPSIDTQPEQVVNDPEGRGGSEQQHYFQEPVQQQEKDIQSSKELVPPPLNSDEQSRLEVQWRQRLAGAAQQALQANKLGGSLARMIEQMLEPELPWRILLARFMSALARDEYSYMRPSRREGEALLPSLHSNQIELVVAIDTSGSIKPGEIDDFFSEINALKGQVQARITLLPCDARLTKEAPWVYEPWDDFHIPSTMLGGGGTDFRPVFDWIERETHTPDLLVYFTDAEGEFPQLPPPYPVIWLVKGKLPVPWGERIQLN